MGKSLTYKILQDKLLSGDLKAGEEIAIRIDHTLTQDSTGTMAYLQLEAMEVDELATELSVAYIDHNTLQAGFENADDHAFIASAAAKYGIVFSKPGGGICHQVQLERFSKPGATLLGSDSHTPTSGGLGSLAIGAGGLDVAVAMAKGFYYLTMPKVFNVYLTGELPRAVNAKDVILEVLRRLTVRGGVGYVMEYSGPGVASLSVTDRATISNMGAELGATTSIFPSDERTLDYLTRQNRAEVYKPLQADEDAVYDERIEIDLSSLVPLVAKPHSPDNVVPISEIEDLKVDQVIIGSCTNSSYADLMKTTAILRDTKVHPDVSLVVAPGSANILRLIIENGAMADIIKAGGRVIESACGPCIGMGQSPRSGAVSLRSFNRNFKGRSGTADASVYLLSPEAAAYSAVTGVLSDPRNFEGSLEVEEPANYGSVDAYFIWPLEDKEDRPTTVTMGPNIKPCPTNVALPDELIRAVIFKAGDQITTDDIVPSSAKYLPYRSNVPKLADFSFSTLIDDFADRTKEHGGGIIVAGENYGQGSSREHAALVPLYLGIRAVIAKSFARIHRANLINAGILPLTFVNEADYETIKEGDELVFTNLLDGVLNASTLEVQNKTQGTSYSVALNASPREREVLKTGGYLRYAREQVFA